MNDQRKIRLVILAFSGLLLVGGVFAGITYNNQKQQEAAELAEQGSAPHSRSPMTTHMGNAPAVASLPGKPSVEDAKEVKEDEEDKATAVKPDAKGAPVVVANAAKPNAAKPVAAAPLAANPAVKPVAPVPAVAIQAAKPVAVAPVMPIPAKPVAVSATPVHAAPPVANAGTLPPARPPAVVPAMSTAVVPVPAPAQKVLPDTNPAAVRPPLQNVLVHHGPGALPPGVIPAPTLEELAAKAAKGELVIATTHQEASDSARKAAGRTNPTIALTGFLPWPRVSNKGKTPSGADGQSMVPPPPPGGAANADDLSDANAPAAKPSGLNNIQGHIADKRVPPPPPSVPGGLDDLNLDQLPVPPSRPVIGDQMKVVSVLDDKAIVTFPKALQRQNKWPKYITLATGEQFDSIKIISVSADGVTIEEDGERSLRPLPTIK